MRKCLVLIAFILCTVAGRSMNPPADEWLELYFNSACLLQARTPRCIISIPLKLTDKSVDPKLIKIANDKPVYVRKEGVFDKVFMDALTVSLDSSHLQLNILADMTRLSVAGNYEMGITLTAGADKKKDLTITFIRPAATLQIDTPVRVKIVENVFAGRTIKSDPLVLKETGNLSSIEALLLHPPHFPGLSKDDLIRIKNNPYTVPANNEAAIKYEVDNEIAGEVPLGEITGTMKISRDELAAPVVLAFKVTRTRSKFLIVIVVFLGVLSGFFLRTYIQSRKSLEEQKILGTELIIKIQNEIKGIKDKAYGNKISSITRKMVDLLSTKASLAFGSSNFDTLTASISQEIPLLATAYNEAKTTFETVLQTVQTDTKKLDKILSNPLLYASLKEQLKDVYTKNQDAKAAMETKNPTQAKSDIEQALEFMQHFFERVFLPGVSDAMNVIETEQLLPAKATDPIKAELKKKLTELKEKKEKMVFATDTLDNAGAAISDALTIQFNLKGLFDYVVKEIKKLFDVHFKDKDYPDMIAFRDAFNAWKNSAELTGQDPVNKFDTSTVNLLNATWDAAIAAEQKRTGATLSLTDATAGSSAAPAWMQIPPATLSQTSDQRFSTTPISTILGQARKSWMTIYIIQTLFVFVLLAFAAYNFYADAFVGTYKELCTIFIAAFGMNVTIENVLTFPGKKPGEA